jgi:hypothetical protein
VSEIPGAHLLLAPIPAVTESPSYERTWRMRGRGGVHPSSASGELAYLIATVPGAGSPPSSASGEIVHDADAVGGASTPPAAPSGAVEYQAVALVGAVT